jgi:hypothetical protein
MMHRRRILTGLVAAPFVARLGLLMPVRSIEPEQTTEFFVSEVTSGRPPRLCANISWTNIATGQTHTQHFPINDPLGDKLQPLLFLDTPIRIEGYTMDVGRA